VVSAWQHHGWRKYYPDAIRCVPKILQDICLVSLTTMNRTDRRELQRSINAKIAPAIPSWAWDSTVAVVVIDRPRVHQLGSATLFQIADAHCVVTAAHVLQSASDRDKTVGISGGLDHYFVPVAENWVRSSPGTGDTPDRYDLAVYRLPDNAVEKLSRMQFFRLSDATFDPPGPRAVYTLFGFPGVWTEPISSETDRLSVKPLEFTTYTYDGNLGGIRHYDPQLHILLAAGSEDLTDLKAHRSNSAIASANACAYLSVCRGLADVAYGTSAIWTCPSNGGLSAMPGWWGWPAPSIKHTARVTRWIAVTTLIDAAFPDLRPVLKLLVR
jgi:hypothetical protein